MEHQKQDAPFRIWVCPARRIVSFHAEEGFDIVGDMEIPEELPEDLPDLQP